PAYLLLCLLIYLSISICYCSPNKLLHVPTRRSSDLSKSTMRTLPSRPIRRQMPAVWQSAFLARVATPLIEFRHWDFSSCGASSRSEEHTSELQSRENIVCRLLLEKKKNK